MACAMQLEPGVEPFPGYRLVRFLGRGGWGEVWRIEHDGDAYAIKFLPTVGPPMAAQEIRGLQAIRQLNHPNLLKTEQVWSGDGFLAILMELADGNLLDLFDVYQSEFGAPITPDHLCYYLLQAAEAIDFLNRRQHEIDGQRVALRHCDVKPSNILIQGRTVKLADFGLAVPTSAKMANHRRVGTMHYAAPEVFQGLLSDRTDQYALAATYVQLRTGRLPFPDSPADFHQPYRRPAPDLAGLSAAERLVLKRAFAAVPQDRWPSCVELMKRLSAAVREPCVA